MAYPQDPGHVFESDAHRRALAQLPPPDESPVGFEEVRMRYSEDEPLVVMTKGDTGKLLTILGELEESADCTTAGGEYQQTPQGHEHLNSARDQWDPEKEEYVEAAPMDAERKAAAVAESDRVTELQEARAAASRQVAWDQAVEDSAEQRKADAALLKKRKDSDALLEAARNHIAERVASR